MITKQEIENLAVLSKLYVAEDEIERLTAEVGRMVAFADAVSEASAEIEDFETINCASNVYRDDVVLPSLSADEILRNAPEQAEGCFLLRKRA